MSEPHYIPELEEQPDAWHRHTPDEDTPQPEHAAHVSPIVMGLTLVSLVMVTLVVSIGVYLYFSGYMNTRRAQQLEGIPAARVEFEQSRDAALTRLDSYGWADKETGAVHIPIDEAMKQVVAEYAAARSGG